MYRKRLEKKKKKCDGCNLFKIIWKSHGKEKFCRSCWTQHPKNAKPIVRISKKSSKQEKRDELYYILNKEYLRAHPMCEAHLIDLAGCTTYATEIHHKKGRGEYYLDSTTFLAVCRCCHSWIEKNPIQAKELNLSLERLTT